MSRPRSQSALNLAAAPTALYRAYTNDSDLLYIGITTDIERRLRQHSRRSTWHSSAALVEVDWYADRISARIAEQFMLDDDTPLHNIARDASLAGMPLVHPERSEAFKMRPDGRWHPYVPTWLYEQEGTSGGLVQGR